MLFIGRVESAPQGLTFQNIARVSRVKLVIVIVIVYLTVINQYISIIIHMYSINRFSDMTIGSSLALDILI